jgi:hypothetical protein
MSAQPQTRNTSTATAPANAPANGGEEKPKRTRTRKPVSVRSAAVKIADLIEKLPSESREKALNIAKALLEAAQ